MLNWIRNNVEVAVRLWQVLAQRPFLLGSNALQVLPSCILSDLIASRI